MRTFIVISALCMACSSSSTSNPTSANSCAEKGATYSETFAQYEGTCGDQMTQTVNVSASGVVTLTAFGVEVTCGTSSVDGCTSTETNCSYTAGDNKCTLYTSLTFSSDGASLTGTETLDCTYGPGNTCNASYKMTGTKQ
jgi:hypothetical protein